ncbi:MAG: RNA 2',3'-cyclic phosphodiesterase [Candidatus Omnitrophica bacterium]|nr:RNA 2',3'-cyclic phosphodiesterase [Candidatus Omnitrophota bacterium]MDD4013650.1 RNA 2',3'-cyclic phosphodiesterase [Candidatus Omnitrophota bacterium]
MMNGRSASREIRSFIALEISDEARSEIVRTIDRLKAEGADVKWSRPDTLHITLRFLGNIRSEQIQPVSKAIEDAASRGQEFDIVIGELGAFPGWDLPRVIWAGIADGADAAGDLARLIEGSLEKEGFPPEQRSFKAHLTIGRVMTPGNIDRLKKAAMSSALSPIRSHVRRIVLFKSELTPAGAVHTPIFSTELKTSENQTGCA